MYLEEVKLVNNKVIDPSYTEISSSTEQEYLTIDEIAKILEVEEYQIIYWCNKFNDILNIQSIGMYSIFNNIDINNLKTIKHLEIDKKMNSRQIREYILKQNQQYGIVTKRKKQELSNASIVSVLAKVINLQNQQITEIKQSNTQILQDNKKLIDMQQEFKSSFLDFCNQLMQSKNKDSANIQESIQQAKTNLQDYIATTVVEEINKKVSTSIDKQLSINTETIQSTIQQSQEQLSNTINNQLKSRDVELTNNLKHILEERKQQALQEQTKPKGFFAKLFRK